MHSFSLHSLFFIFSLTFCGFLVSLYYTGHFSILDLSDIRPPSEHEVPPLAAPLVSSTPDQKLDLRFEDSEPLETSFEEGLDGSPIHQIIPDSDEYPNVTYWPNKKTESCDCKSEKSGKVYNFCYVNPYNTSLIGRKFSCEHLKTLEKLELIDNPGPFVNFSDSAKIDKKIVFCSAISDDHFMNGMDSIGSFRKFNPTRKFILYGLNLSPVLVEKIQKLHHVEFRPFNTTGYPSYARHWMEYRFKPLIIAELMREYPNIWWIDAHLTVKKANMTGLLASEIAETKASGSLPSSLIFFIFTGHGNFPVMKPELLSYFPSNSMNLLKNDKIAHQLGANTFYVARTEYTVKVFKWWILCALDQTCLAPKGAKVHCRFRDNRFTENADCFRYDQSVINLLLLNDFQDHHKYQSKLGHIF